MRCRTIEHTADLGIEVEADTLEELFEAAAAGMFSIIVETSQVSQVVTERVALDGSDLEELMFKWLNELLYLLGARRLLFSVFEVESIETLHLEASVGGETVDPDRHRALADIKGATYHQMLVERRGSSWFARIIFDV